MVRFVVSLRSYRSDRSNYSSDKAEAEAFKIKNKGLLVDVRFDESTRSSS